MGLKQETLATVREDGNPQVTTVSYVNKGFDDIFRLRGQIAEGRQYRPP
jgi:hypothetical protein